MGDEGDVEIGGLWYLVEWFFEVIVSNVIV